MFKLENLKTNLNQEEEEEIFQCIDTGYYPK